jgi:uncharacterized cupredoxin-like copper-binding protein
VSRNPSRLPVVVVVGGLGLAVALVVLGAALAAAPAPTPVIAGPGNPDSPRSLNVIMRDYKFDPTPLYVVRGETVRITVVNGGMLEHELVLGDEDVQAAWAVADAASTPPAPFTTPPPASVGPDVGGLRVVLGSGGAATLDYVVPASGTVQLVCHLPGHAERGMIGEVAFLVPPS